MKTKICQNLQDVLLNLKFNKYLLIKIKNNKIYNLNKLNKFIIIIKKVILLHLEAELNIKFNKINKLINNQVIKFKMFNCSKILI